MRDTRQWGTAKETTEAMGGKWHETYGMIPCPCRNDDKNPSCSIRQGRIAPLFKCQLGRCNSMQITRFVASRIDMGVKPLTGGKRAPPRHFIPLKPIDPQPEAKRTWQDAMPVNEAGQDYLSKLRCIPYEWQAFVSPFVEFGGRLLRSAENIRGRKSVLFPLSQGKRLHSLQWSFIDRQHPKKIILKGRLNMGRLDTSAGFWIYQDPAVRPEKIFVCEGGEDALSIACCLKRLGGITQPWAVVGCPGASVLSSLGLPPPGQAEVVWIADGDKPGQDNATKAYAKREYGERLPDEKEAFASAADKGQRSRRLVFLPQGEDATGLYEQGQEDLLHAFLTEYVSRQNRAVA